MGAICNAQMQPESPLNDSGREESFNETNVQESNQPGDAIYETAKSLVRAGGICFAEKAALDCSTLTFPDYKQETIFPGIYVNRGLKPRLDKFFTNCVIKDKRYNFGQEKLLGQKKTDVMYNNIWVTWRQKCNTKQRHEKEEDVKDDETEEINEKIEGE
eukprot:UN24498